jgi:hypothetical protein
MTWGKFLGRVSKQTLLELRLKNVTPVTRARLHAHAARGNSRSGNRDREYVSAMQEPRQAFASAPKIISQTIEATGWSEMGAMQVDWPTEID